MKRKQKNQRKHSPIKWLALHMSLFTKERNAVTIADGILGSCINTLKEDRDRAATVRERL